MLGYMIGIYTYIIYIILSLSLRLQNPPGLLSTFPSPTPGPHSCSKAPISGLPRLEWLTRLELPQVTDLTCDLLSPPNIERRRELREFRSFTPIVAQRQAG